MPGPMGSGTGGLVADVEGDTTQAVTTRAGACQPVEHYTLDSAPSVRLSLTAHLAVTDCLVPTLYTSILE